MKSHLRCAAILIVSFALVTVGCSKGFTPGTYSKTISGHNAPFTVSVTVDKKSITNIDVSKNLETIGVGQLALEQLANEVVAKQSVALDSISGATVTSMAFFTVVKDCLKEAGGDLQKLTAVPESKKLPDETLNTEVVIIGGGGAGLAAAISAEQSGARVIVLEKLGLLGGSTNVSEGALNAVDPKRQTPQKIEDSVEKFYSQTITGGHNKGTPALVDYLTSNAYDAVEWMEGLGVQFKDEIGAATGSLWTRSHYPVTPSGNSYIRVFEDYAKTHDAINVILNAKAVELIQDASGRVTGVIAENQGRKLTVNASKGVIVATGGFGANVELRQKVNTGVWASANLGDSIGTTNMSKSAQGDGIFMAEKIGADVIGMSDIQLHPCGKPKNGLMVDIRTSGNNRIFVNSNGERFVNENAARDTLVKAIFDQKDSQYWILVNSLRYPSRDWVDANGATIENMVAQGDVIEADTLEDLCAKTGMDADKLKASLEQYNQVVRKEVAKDAFGFVSTNPKDAQLTDGPWYACLKVPTVHHTMGGIKINENTQVLDKANKIIPGLYAAGEVTGGIHGSNRLGGNAIADCMVFGRQAGVFAAKN